MKRPLRSGETGAALLAVLLLVVVMGAIAAGAFEKLRLSTALAVNNVALDQARAYAVGIESLASLRVEDLVAAGRSQADQDESWNGELRQIPLPGGGIGKAILRDGGNCFNLNSVAEGETGLALVPRPAGMLQFIGLMRVLEIPRGVAEHIAAATGDWVDSDSEVSRSGAEDPAYADGALPYRTGNTMFAEVSELRALDGMNADIYARLRPFLCALPSTELSPINLNTLTLDQAPILAMLAPDQLSIAAARQLIASRPASGWRDMTEFYRSPAIARLSLPLDVQSQPQLRTSWFALDLRIELRGAELHETALLDARLAPARIVARRWGSDD